MKKTHGQGAASQAEAAPLRFHAWLEAERISELAGLAAAEGAYTDAAWLDRFARHLAKHKRLTPRQAEVLTAIYERWHP